MTIEQILKLGEMGYTKEEISRLEQQEPTVVQNQPQQEPTVVQNQPQQNQTEVQNQQEPTVVQNPPQQEQTEVQNPPQQNQNDIFKALLTELGAIKGAIQNNNAATLTQPAPKQETAGTILASLLVPPAENK